MLKPDVHYNSKNTATYSVDKAATRWTISIVAVHQKHLFHFDTHLAFTAKAYKECKDVFVNN